MRGYEEYRESRVKWLGEIPAHWRERKIGSLFVERRSKVSDRDYLPLSVTKFGIVPQLETAAKSDDSDNRKLVCAGDFVINSRSDRKGSCGLSEFTGSVSLINIVLTPRDSLHNKYVHYLLRSHPFSEEFYRHGKGIVADLWTTRYSEMKAILLPVPPKDEQDQIARFLDWKISAIDRLIFLRHRQLTDLEDLKKSAITKAVTRGLNPEVELRDSGVKWLGQIPSGWGVVRLKRVCDVTLGKMLAPNPSSNADTLEEYICARDVHSDGINLDDLKKMWFKPNEKKQYRVYDGDLLVVEGGAVGNCAIVKNLCGRAVYVQNSIHIIRPKDDSMIMSYVYYSLQHLCNAGYIESVSNVATIAHYTKQKVLSTIIPIPPTAEQQQISTYLDKLCSLINHALTNLSTQIDTLRELKARLISDTVTGKIDVRHIPIPGQENP